jgi:hypothetical protein
LLSAEKWKHEEFWIFKTDGHVVKSNRSYWYRHDRDLPVGHKDRCSWKGMNLIYESNAEMLFWEGLPGQRIKPSRQALRKARSSECAHSGRSWLLSNPASPFGSCQERSVPGFTWPDVYKKATTSKQAGESNWESGCLNHR